MFESFDVKVCDIMDGVSTILQVDDLFYMIHFFEMESGIVEDFPSKFSQVIFHISEGYIANESY